MKAFPVLLLAAVAAGPPAAATPPTPAAPPPAAPPPLVAVAAPTPAAPSPAAPPPAAPPPLDAATLAELAHGQRRTERRAMGVLLGWSAVNLIAGGAGALTAESPREIAFWQGNAGWNVVNLGIAGAALLRDRRPGPVDLAKARARADGFDRALLVNIGLDVAYLAASWALRERAVRIESAQLLGFGDALALQGAFLLGFDVGALLAHQRWSRPLRGRTRTTSP